MIIIQICFTIEPRSGLMTDSGLSFGCSKRFIVQQRIKRIILIYHAARRCIFLMPQAATNEIEWLHSAFVFIRCTFRCIVHCINSKYSKYWLRRAKGSLLKKASEPLARRSQTSVLYCIGCWFIRRKPFSGGCWLVGF